MISYRRPDFDLRSADFWLLSLDFALDVYMRCELSLQIDAKYIIAEDLLNSLSDRDYAVIRFTLFASGKMKEWRHERSSSHPELARALESAFVQTCQKFPPLPTGSPLELDFAATGDWTGVQVFSSLHDISYRCATQSNLTSLYGDPGAIYTVIVRPDEVIVEPIVCPKAPSFTPAEIAEPFRRLIRFTEQIQELRLMINYESDTGRGCLNAYKRCVPRIYDALDKSMLLRRHLRSIPNRRNNLILTEDKLRKKFSLNLLRDKILLLQSFHGIESALQYIQTKEEAHPCEAFYWRAHCLLQEGQRRQDFANLTDDILSACHSGLSKIRKSSKLYSWFVSAICTTLAIAGRYEDFIEAEKNIIDDVTQSRQTRFVVHKYMAEYLERTYQWENAVKEWKIALGATRELQDIQEINSALAFCYWHIENGDAAIRRFDQAWQKCD